MKEDMKQKVMFNYGFLGGLGLALSHEYKTQKAWLEKTLFLVQSCKNKEELLTFSKHPDYPVRLEVAKNPNTPLEALISLSDDSHITARFAVTQNDNTSLDILEKLSRDESVYVRGGVAENNRSTENILELLSKNSSSVCVLEKVALNVKTPPDILVIFSFNPFYEVRRAVAKNPNTPIRTLWVLENDFVDNVRESVRNNPSYKKPARAILDKILNK